MQEKSSGDDNDDDSGGGGDTIDAPLAGRAINGVVGRYIGGLYLQYVRPPCRS